MISYVAKAITLIAVTIQNVILTASITGELILTTALWIFSVLMNLLESIVDFFYIVYEDNVFILTEIPNSTKDMAYSAYKQLVLLQNLLEMAFSSIFNKIDAMFSTSKSLTNSLILIVSEVLKLMLNMAAFIGETTWLIITFIPVHLPQLTKAAMKQFLDIIIDLIVNAYMKLLTFTNYLTEVPLESFLGIISAIVIVRLSVHFHETLMDKAIDVYWALVRNITYFYYLCYNYFINPELQILTGMARGDVMRASEENLETVDGDDVNNGADVLCVICQERHKCVLTLPCRHICLCTECCRRLYGYQRTCPICRTFIYHSVTVYL